jgi:thioredoxin-related protein
MPRVPTWIALLATGLLLAPTAGAFELVMFRRTGCPWCAAWDRDIGPIYAKTEVGRRTPIRHVDLDRDAGAKLKLVSPVRFTPTFVLVEGDHELGRIEGYPGEDFFWGLLERLMPRPKAETSNEAVR